jgi:predicted NAD-dependent protein-ADP-ribosyltransferase YbiA (DUF1768 family)
MPGVIYFIFFIGYIFMMKYLILLIFISCASSFSEDNHDYPDLWWEPITTPKKAWWEIAPDSVKRADNEVILSKRNELGILSNFAHTPFEFRGKSYESIEGLWQSMKFPESTNDPRHRFGVWKYKRNDVSQMLGFDAKEAGSYASKLMKDNNINWVSFNGSRFIYRTSDKGAHYKIIKEAMIEKLEQNIKVKNILISTGNLILKADHKTKITDPPAWKYYKIWMEIRESIKH